MIMIGEPYRMAMIGDHATLGPVVIVSSNDTMATVKDDTGKAYRVFTRTITNVRNA